jgi:hypothetical protein
VRRVVRRVVRREVQQRVARRLAERRKQLVAHLRPVEHRLRVVQHRAAQQPAGRHLERLERLELRQAERDRLRLVQRGELLPELPRVVRQEPHLALAEPQAHPHLQARRPTWDRPIFRRRSSRRPRRRR